MEKLNLLVSPSDTANNSERWYEFALYLGKGLARVVSPDSALDQNDFRQRMAQADLVYATPQEAVLLHLRLGFEPLCRPAVQFEEVALVAAPTAENKTLQGFHQAAVASVPFLLPTRLGRTLLAKQGIRPALLIAKGKWLQVLKALQQGEAEYAFLSKTFYDELNPLSRGSIALIACSRLRKAAPVLLLNPAAALSGEAVLARLEGMHEDGKGQQVLEKLGLSGWARATSDELQLLGRIIGVQ